jgi:hypothetical protein
MSGRPGSLPAERGLRLMLVAISIGLAVALAIAAAARFLAT